MDLFGVAVQPPTGPSEGAQEETDEGSDPGPCPYCATVDKTLPFSGLLAHRQNQACPERPRFFAPLLVAAGSVSLAPRPVPRDAPAVASPMTVDSWLCFL